MTRAVLFALSGLGLWGCTAYSRIEHYFCIAPSHIERCQPPYHDPTAWRDPRTKDDDVRPAP